MDYEIDKVLRYHDSDDDGDEILLSSFSSISVNSFEKSEIEDI